MPTAITKRRHFVHNFQTKWSLFLQHMNASHFIDSSFEFLLAEVCPSLE